MSTQALTHDVAPLSVAPGSGISLPSPACFIHCHLGIARLVCMSLHDSVISSDGTDSMDCSILAHLSHYEMEAEDASAAVLI